MIEIVPLTRSEAICSFVVSLVFLGIASVYNLHDWFLIVLLPTFAITTYLFIRFIRHGTNHSVDLN